MRRSDQHSSFNDYERIRNDRIAQNKMRLQEFGIQNIAKSLTSLVESSKSNKRKEKEIERPNSSTTRDMDYFPDNSDEEDIPLNVEIPKKVSQSQTRQRVQYIPPRSVTRFSSVARQVLPSKNHGLSNKNQQVSQIQSLFDKEKTFERRDTPGEKCTQNNHGKKMTMADLILHTKMLQREKEVSNDHAQLLTRTSTIEDINMGSEMTHNVYVETSPTVRDISAGSKFGCEGSSQLGRNEFMPSGLEGDELDDIGTENDDTAPESEEESTEDESEHIDLDDQDLALEAMLQGKTRGPTMLHHVHTRSLEEREAVILNEFGQPIPIVNGKDTAVKAKAKDTVGEFSRFLGTIARDYSYAPLVFDSWRKVPSKDKMWEYVLMKYVVPDEGKDWVIRTIGAAWRIHKCRFKRKHYYQYKDDKTRWQNRSKTVPDDDFLKLLAKWKKKSEKIRCSRNRDRRLAQKNMHTAGPKSFASIREEMKTKNPDKKPPSLAELFERTRKKKEGNIYKESFEDTTKKIADMKSYAPDDDGSGSTDPFLAVMGKEYNGRRRLYGRGVCNKKLKQVNGTSTSYVVPGEILESLKTSLVEDLRKDVDSEMNRVGIFYKDMEEDHLKKKEELENMQKDIDHQRETMTEQIMKKIMEKLPQEIVRQYLL